MKFKGATIPDLVYSVSDQINASALDFFIYSPMLNSAQK
jgi:hypothetical protein|tara:strand:+ start:1941 stop:2057 length:117 start_codon:yes stop_codon:yes gene_type:complete